MKSSRIVMYIVFWFMWGAQFVASGEGSIRRDLESHMRQIADQARTEAEVDPFEHGKDEYAVALCKAQNFVERGSFADAAGVLSAIPADRVRAYEREDLLQRIRILEKWGKTRRVEDADFRAFYMEGYRRWFLGRARLIMSHWENLQIPDKEKLPMLAEMLEERGDKAGAALAWQVTAGLEGIGNELKSDALLAAGNALFESGNPSQAEDLWLRIPFSAETAPAWSKARFNLGLLEEKRMNYEAAIGFYEDLLRSKPNNKEPGSHLMETYRNYSNRSAMRISYCYEQMGNYGKALRYARLAKNRYPFVSWCGTCLSGANWAINQRIAYLAARTRQFQAAGIAALAGGLLARRYWIKRRK